jgi:prepilin-type processing-associated H-X9-DG protein
VARLTGIEKRHLAVLEQQESDAPLYRPTTEQPCGPGMTARTEAFDRLAPSLIARLLSPLSADQLKRVGALVTVSCTHASSPGLEQPIFAAGQIPADVERWNLGFMGCSAGLSALRLVRRWVDEERPALVVACELASLHFQYTDELDQMTANVLFADGAAAVLLGPAISPVCVVDGRCRSFPQVADQMVWFAGDHGLQLRLSADLPDTIAEHLPGCLLEFLHRNGLGVTDVDHWLVHPGGPQILDAVQRALKLPENALELSRRVLRQFGNMSSPTIFFILKELLDSRTTGRAVAVAFGPGLTIEMALLRIGGH